MGELTKREKALVAWIKSQGSVTVSQVAENFKVALSTAGVHLHNLRNKDALVCTGLGRYARWSVVEQAHPVSQPANIEQVSSIWHYAARHARAG